MELQRNVAKLPKKFLKVKFCLHWKVLQSDLGSRNVGIAIPEETSFLMRPPQL